VSPANATLATVRFVLSLVGAGVFVVAGRHMLALESVSGNSVAEEFYNAMGLFAYGMAALSVVIGLPVIPGSAGGATDSSDAEDGFHEPREYGTRVQTTSFVKRKRTEPGTSRESADRDTQSG